MPFLISGKAKFIDWHIIDWDPNDKKHRAIFTHHSSDLHMHFKTEDNRLAGHIDNLELGSDMVLKLPRIKR